MHCEKLTVSINIHIFIGWCQCQDVKVNIAILSDLDKTSPLGLLSIATFVFI